MNRLIFDGLYVGYDGDPVIKDLKHFIPDGEITTIIGANGCGKSTLLKALARIIPYQKGQVLLDGQLIHKESTRILAQKMAMLSQKQPVLDGLTAQELVAYGRFPHQGRFASLKSSDQEIINWAMEVTETDRYREKEVSSLSGGQLQRVWIAMALAQETEIILLDEPTTYLDMAHQMEVLELLKKLNKEQGRTIVMVLHDINHAARFSDHMIAMKNGTIIKSGTCEQVMNERVLREVYNIEAFIGRDPVTHKPMCVTYSTCEGGKIEKVG